MGRAKEKIDEKKLRSWRLLDDFRSRLTRIRAAMPPPPEKRPGGPERLLLEEDYFSLMLFGMLNPVLDTMRGLCAASHLERVQDQVCGRKVSLGSFSEAQGVFSHVPSINHAEQFCGMVDLADQTRMELSEDSGRAVASLPSG